MMRLTVRSGKDGRFLARIVEPGAGAPFVLDFGDKRIIDDAQQRLLHGFTMWRFGQLVHALPQDPDMTRLLAEFYCGEGLLVALEEPTWPGRDRSLDGLIPVPAIDVALMGAGWPGDLPQAPAVPAVAPLVPLRLPPAAPLDDLDDADDATELVELDELTDLDPHSTRIVTRHDNVDEIEDQATEILDK